MYFIENQNRLSGFAEPSTLAQAKAAIMAALQRNPVGGYIVNTPARRALEDAFGSVPSCSALELQMELNRRQTPLAKLFHYRLATATRAVMSNILTRKQIECIDQTFNRPPVQAPPPDPRAREEKRKEFCAAIKKMEESLQTICKISGEESDDCQKWRFELLAAREKLSSSGFRCP